MSKESEALKNIVKEISAYKLHGLGDRNWMGVQDVLQDVSIVEEALEKAQKQEKLLELYRELDDCIVAPGGHHVCRYTDDKKYARIRKQIKEIEK